MTRKNDFESRWAKFLETRARRLRTTEHEAAMPTSSGYLAALKEKADRLGISLEQAKQHRGAPQYPTEDCILPTELADFMNGEELSESSVRHLGECSACCALLDMAGPSEDRLKALLEEVRIRVGEKAVCSEANLAQLFDTATVH